MRLDFSSIRIIRVEIEGCRPCCAFAEWGGKETRREFRRNALRPANDEAVSRVANVEEQNRHRQQCI
jgi:hypothetical protein